MCVCLQEVMPLPPEGDAATEALEGGVSLEFSRVECLLFSFHQLARHQPEFLSNDQERLKDFRIRSGGEIVCLGVVWCMLCNGKKIVIIVLVMRILINSTRIISTQAAVLCSGVTSLSEATKGSHCQ